MSLASWRANGWLRSHEPSRGEIASLMEIVGRDLSDAHGNISADWRFGIAYNAALKLCTVLLQAEGYRAERTLQHYRTIQALPLILGAARAGDADYLETCSQKRNAVEYQSVGAVTAGDADELIEFVEELRSAMQEWLAAHHPSLASEP